MPSTGTQQPSAVLPIQLTRHRRRPRSRSLRLRFASRRVHSRSPRLAAFQESPGTVSSQCEEALASSLSFIGEWLPSKPPEGSHCRDRSIRRPPRSRARCSADPGILLHPAHQAKEYTEHPQTESCSFRIAIRKHAFLSAGLPILTTGSRLNCTPLALRP